MSLAHISQLAGAGTQIPTLTRNDTVGGITSTVNVPEGVQSFDDGTGNPVRKRLAIVFKLIAAAAAGSGLTVWTPATGKKVRLMGGCISVSGAANVLFTESGTTAQSVFQTPALLAGAPWSFDLGNGILLASASDTLVATSSATANLVGTLWGTEE